MGKYITKHFLPLCNFLIHRYYHLFANISRTKSYPLSKSNVKITPVKDRQSAGLFRSSVMFLQVWWVFVFQFFGGLIQPLSAFGRIFRPLCFFIFFVVYRRTLLSCIAYFHYYIFNKNENCCIDYFTIFFLGGG